MDNVETERSDARRQPAIFVGHGSPMNAIEDNPFSRAWNAYAQRLDKLPERPRAIVAVSAHWTTDALAVRTAADNPVINDMYGFPQPLYELGYSPAGDPALARRVMELAGGAVHPDNDWGIDHGVWAPLTHLFPEADVPVVMVSVAPSLGAKAHFELGRALRPLRDQGVLILGSGNVVHSFRYADPGEPESMAPWAEGMDSGARDSVRARDWDAEVSGAALGKDGRKAFQTTEHYLPLPAVLGAAYEDEDVEVWNEGGQLGSFSMTSYSFGMPRA